MLTRRRCCSCAPLVYLLGCAHAVAMTSATKRLRRWLCTLALVAATSSCCCWCTSALAAANDTSANATSALRSTQPSTSPAIAPLTRADSAAAFCLGFLLPDQRSVVSTTHCASNSSARVVLIGADHAPVVVDASSFTLREQALHSNIGVAIDASVAVATLLDPRAKLSSGVVFDVPTATRSERAQRMVRYTLKQQIAPLSSEHRSTAAGVALAQFELHAVATSECEAITTKPLAQHRRGTTLCAKGKWPSVVECERAQQDSEASSAGLSASASELVTLQQRGAEYAVGFVTARSPCSASGSRAFLVSAVVVDQALGGDDGASGVSVSQTKTLDSQCV